MLVACPLAWRWRVPTSMTRDSSKPRWTAFQCLGHDLADGASNISAATRVTMPMPFVAPPAIDATLRTSVPAARNKSNAVVGRALDVGS